jgi:anti-sigma B factor antagonist
MEIIDKQINNMILIKLAGRLNSLFVKQFKNKINSLIKNQQVYVVFGLSEVTFMDSSGLGGLVASLRSIGQAGGDIKIASLLPRVRALFELTRLHQVFEIFNDADTAIQSFS